MKQYFIAPAYSGNYHVVRVNDGKIECDEILAHYELDGYVSAVESFGYRKAEYVPAAEAELKKAEQALEMAKKALEEAKKNPLKLDEKHAKKYHLVGDCDPDFDDDY
jgi:hypothetical protein